MKKTLFFSFLFLVVMSVSAQDLKKIKSYSDSKQWDKAKTEVDAFIAKNPTSAEGYYAKSKVYSGLASNEQFKTLTADPRGEAFEAFKKAVELDKDNKLMVLMVQDQYKPVIDLYTGYFESGAAFYNNGIANKNKADYEKAMNEFINANKVGTYINQKKWVTLGDLDTTLTLNIAKSALNAGKKEDALLYFKKLAVANVVSTKDDKVGYTLVYQWLTQYYKDAKDEANMIKYADLGRKYFPNDDFYDAMLIEYYRGKKDHDALFKKYDEIVTRFPDSSIYHFNYANDAFNYVYNSDAGVKVTDKEAVLKKAGDEMQKALALKPNDVNTNWLLGQYYYNGGIDLREQANAIKGTKPDDVKKKADLNAQAKDLFMKAIPYAEKALSIAEVGAKKSEKSRYKSVVDIMQRIYSGLNQPDKAKSYQQKYDAADSKFVN
jgi:predicted Zn-dependent protease